MKLNTKTVIQSLPFDESLKRDILSKWDSMNPDLQYEIENLVWEAYFELENIKVDEQLQQNLQKAKTGEVPLNADFYKKAVEAAEEEKGEEIHQSADTVELAAVRQKLEQLMQKEN